MSRYADKLFWVVMVIIVLVIGFLSYVTFFYQTSSVQSGGANTQQPIDSKPQPPLAAKIKNLYVCADEATIRSTPAESGQPIQPAKKGERIAVIGEERDWFKIKMTGEKTGWIEKKNVCDQPPKSTKEVKQEAKQEAKTMPPSPPQPPVTKPANPTPPLTQPPMQEYPAGAADSVESLIDGLLERINSRTQMQFGQPLFNDYTMLDSGMRLEVKATSAWKLLPQNYKTQVLQVLSNQYTLIACNIAKIVNCTPNNTPSISIIDSSGHEIAYQNPSGSQILE
ncbi:MAG: SH3 domain-containing protein [bacterium]|nr:SH3 domain-containing protein [bacterium]